MEYRQLNYWFIYQQLVLLVRKLQGLINDQTRRATLEDQYSKFYGIQPTNLKVNRPVATKSGKRGK